MNKCINNPINEDITFDALYIEYIHYRNLRSSINGSFPSDLVEDRECN
jgi:hypothetical protein